MLQRLDGEGVEIPHIGIISPRFRLRYFLTWAAEEPGRIHQVASAILQQNGLNSNHLRILREFDGVLLTKPSEFWDRFDRIHADTPRGTVTNPVFSALVVSWAGAGPGQQLDRQKLRQLAALILFANGFTTVDIATVLGWAAKGTVSRAMQAAREEIQLLSELN